MRGTKGVIVEDDVDQLSDVLLTTVYKGFALKVIFGRIDLVLASLSGAPRKT